MNGLTSIERMTDNSGARTSVGSRSIGRGAYLGVAAAVLLAVGSCTSAPGAHASQSTVDQARGKAWVGTWSASPQLPSILGSPIVPGGQQDGFINQTVRNIVRTSIGGNSVRVRLTNAYGTTPLVIGAAHIAFRST